MFKDEKILKTGKGLAAGNENPIFQTSALQAWLFRSRRLYAKDL
jgi:hypothetical protein